VTVDKDLLEIDEEDRRDISEEEKEKNPLYMYAR
jgi:hypothetical protein